LSLKDIEGAFTTMNMVKHLIFRNKYKLRWILLNVLFQKISILPLQKGLEFPAGGGGGGSGRTKNLKKCIKLNWNFQRGG